MKASEEILLVKGGVGLPEMGQADDISSDERRQDINPI